MMKTQEKCFRLTRFCEPPGRSTAWLGQVFDRHPPTEQSRAGINV